MLGFTWGEVVDSVTKACQFLSRPVTHTLVQCLTLRKAKGFNVHFMRITLDFFPNLAQL